MASPIREGASFKVDGGKYAGESGVVIGATPRRVKVNLGRHGIKYLQPDSIRVLPVLDFADKEDPPTATLAATTTSPKPSTAATEAGRGGASDKSRPASVLPIADRSGIIFFLAVAVLSVAPMTGIVPGFASWKSPSTFTDNSGANMAEFFAKCATGGAPCVIDVDKLLSFADQNIRAAQISNDLVLRDSAMLESLRGLQSIERVLGDLMLLENPALKTLEGLTNLAHVGDDITIIGNTRLQSIASLLGLSGDHLGDINVHANPTLVSLSGFDRLTSVGGNLHVSNCEALVNLAGIHNITKVGGSLLLVDNDAMQTLDGLKVESIGADLGIVANQALKTIRVDSLKSVGGVARIADNTVLRDIGFRSLREVGGLAIVNNAALTDTSGLQLLEKVHGDLSIEDNGALADLRMDDTATETSDFKRLRVIGGSLRVTRNNLLAMIQGFNKLEVVGGDVLIQTNPVLSSAAGFSSLRVVDGSLVISGNKKIGDIAFPVLELVGGDVVIDRCNNLRSLDGLSRLRTVGGNLIITHNIQLAALGGHHGKAVSKAAPALAIKRVYGEIVIDGNPSLKDVSALRSLECHGGVRGFDRDQEGSFVAPAWLTGLPRC